MATSSSGSHPPGSLCLRLAICINAVTPHTMSVRPHGLALRGVLTGCSLPFVLCRESLSVAATSKLLCNFIYSYKGMGLSMVRIMNVFFFVCHFSYSYLLATCSLFSFLIHSGHHDCWSRQEDGKLTCWIMLHSLDTSECSFRFDNPLLSARR